MKSISINKCSECPYFSEFPAEYFEGSCTNGKSSKNTRDNRIANKDAIPRWCPL